MSKTFLNPTPFVFFLIISLIAFSPLEAKRKKKKSSQKVKVLIIDGQSNNHENWKAWTPVLLKQLDDTGSISGRCGHLSSER
jgi:hypothetical protein